MRDFKNLEDIIDLCRNELDEDMEVNATLDLEDLRDLRDLLNIFNSRKEKNYIYFVSYLYSSGYGNTELGFRKKIDSLKDIQEIQFRISKANRIHGVKIINFILLDEVGGL